MPAPRVVALLVAGLTGVLATVAGCGTSGEPQASYGALAADLCGSLDLPAVLSGVDDSLTWTTTAPTASGDTDLGTACGASDEAAQVFVTVAVRRGTTAEARAQLERDTAGGGTTELDGWWEEGAQQLVTTSAVLLHDVARDANLSLDVVVNDSGVGPVEQRATRSQALAGAALDALPDHLPTRTTGG